MKILTLRVGALNTNSYLIIDGPKAALIDPAGSSEAILAALRKEQALLEKIFLTHGHADHVAVAMELKRATGGRIYGHPADNYLLGAVEDEVAAYLGLTEAITIDENLVPGEDVDMAGTLFRVLSTPGHTPGSCCYYSEGERVLFSGDTLFAQGIGRSDLLGGNGKLLQESLNILKELPGNTQVFPGHGPATTIEQERARNRYW